MTATQMTEAQEVLAAIRAEREAAKRAEMADRNAIAAARSAFFSRWSNGVPADLHPEVRAILGKTVLNELEAIHGRDEDREQCALDAAAMVEAEAVAAAECDCFIDGYEIAYRH